jgi:hypothetical protein
MDSLRVTRDDRVAVVIITMNGRERIVRTLRHLLSLPEGPRWTLHVLRSSPANATTALGCFDALRWLVRLPSERRPLSPEVEAATALLDESKINSRARCYGRDR